MSLPALDFLMNTGLNRQHVFNLADLPAELVASLQPAAHERQLILFGHAGRRLWECVQADGIRSRIAALLAAMPYIQYGGYGVFIGFRQKTHVNDTGYV